MSGAYQPLLKDLRMEEIGGWQCFNFKLDLSEVVDVFYGHDFDASRQPTIIMGISPEGKPSLETSNVFKCMMPGNRILGLEVHQSGDMIVWKDHDPLNEDAAGATLMKQGAFPHGFFRFKCWGGCLYIMYGNRVLHRFNTEDLGTKNKQFFHLYRQGIDHDRTKVRLEPQAAARNVKDSIIISVHHDDLTALLHLPLEHWTAIVSEKVVWYLKLFLYHLASYPLWIACLVRKFLKCVSLELGAAFEQGHRGNIFAIRALPSGTYMFTLGESEAKVWDIVTGRKVYELSKGHDVRNLPSDLMGDKSVHNCSACWCEMHTGRKDVVAIGRQDFSIILIEMTYCRGDELKCTYCTKLDHDPIGELEHPEDRVGLRNLCYDPASDALLSAGGGTVRVWSWTMNKDDRKCKDSKVVFEAEKEERIASFAMTDCESDPSNRRTFAVAVDKQQGETWCSYLYIIKVHIDVKTGEWKSEEQCKISNVKGYGGITTTLLCNYQDCTYLIFGTSTGRVVLMKAAQCRGQVALESTTQGDEKVFVRLKGHGEFRIWRIIVVPYRHNFKGKMCTVHLIVTSCGDHTIKLWRLQDAIALFSQNVALEYRPDETGRMRSKFSSETVAFFTLHHHSGAVSALEFKEGSEGQRHDSGMWTFNANDMDQCLYSADWDRVACRWLLGDILEQFDEELQSDKPMEVNQQACKFVSPQQTYKSVSLFEVLSPPASWCMNLVTLIWIVLRGGQPNCNEGVAKMPLFFGLLELDFWYVWVPGVILASLLVMSLWYDCHNHHQGKIDVLARKPDFHEVLKHQKDAAYHRERMHWYFSFNWIVSQFIWVFIMQLLVMTWDCTLVDMTSNGKAWKQDYLRKHSEFRGADFVMDEDRNVKCFRGVHLVLCALTFFLLLLYVHLSIPLLVALGDSRLVTPEADLGLLRRSCFGTTFKFKPHRQQWPNYASMFTRHRAFYRFEATLMVAKIGIPVVVALSTNFPRIRFFVTGAMGLLVFFAASHAPPVPNRLPSMVIILLALCLLIIPLCQLYHFEESGGRKDRLRCHISSHNLHNFV